MKCQPLTNFRAYRIEIYDPKKYKRYKLMPEVKKIDYGACSVPNSADAELFKLRKLVQRTKSQNLDMDYTRKGQLEVRV